jgi:hypothetical protein
MKKELKSVLVVWTLLTALVLGSCDVSGGIGEGQTKTDAAQEGGIVYGETAYGEVSVGADGKATLTVTIQDAAPEASGEAGGVKKSVTGLGQDEIETAAARGVINYRELIMIDNADLGRIVEFNSVSGTSPVRLSGGVVIGKTYHILILSGHKEAGAPPTLLASS